MKLVVIIPAYNEEKTIAQVIQEIPRKLVASATKYLKRGYFSLDFFTASADISIPAPSHCSLIIPISSCEPQPIIKTLPIMFLSKERRTLRLSC